jgi:hypothetical protein
MDKAKAGNRVMPRARGKAAAMIRWAVRAGHSGPISDKARISYRRNWPAVGPVKFWKNCAAAPMSKAWMVRRVVISTVC